MIYHGFKSIDEPTVIPGNIREIKQENNKYYVVYFKRIKSRYVGSDFDDMGNRKIAEAYHYQQKLFN